MNDRWNENCLKNIVYFGLKRLFWTIFTMWKYHWFLKELRESRWFYCELFVGFKIIFVSIEINSTFEMEDNKLPDLFLQ